ncbi:MAG: ABC transporter ATP-binding protein [Alphaproteobacteria bacterium]|nr:ABC transporter ATP-binding protein [Alphaproteobacteria bacterium]
MTADSAIARRARKDLVVLRDVRLNLSSAAGPVEILRGVDFTVAEGEAVGVVGPSGSGKSTMMAVMSGLERPSSGSVRIADQEIGSAISEDALALFRRRHIGIVFQSFHLVTTMTALENVAIPLELSRDRAAFARAEETLRAVGLGHRLDHYPAQLSGGEQQRVALARAFVTKPNLLLADEPTGNLDGETGRAVIETLFAMRDREQTTLVLITHEERLARRCDRIVRMRDGVIERDSATAAAQ